MVRLPAAVRRAAAAMLRNASSTRNVAAGGDGAGAPDRGPAGWPCRSRRTDARELYEAASLPGRDRTWPRISSDCVVAPLFLWFFSPLPGALAYKAINTADSMIANKSPRHLAFGWASARLRRPRDLSGVAALRSVAGRGRPPAGLSPGAAPWRRWRRTPAINRSSKRRLAEPPWAGALGIRLSCPRISDGVASGALVGEENGLPCRSRYSRIANTLSNALRAAIAVLAAIALGLQALIPSGRGRLPPGARIQRREGRQTINMNRDETERTAQTACANGFAIAGESGETEMPN